MGWARKKLPAVIEQYNKNVLGVVKGGQHNIFTDNSRKSMWWFANVEVELIPGSCTSDTYIFHTINYLYSGTTTYFRKGIVKNKLKTKTKIYQ